MVSDEELIKLRKQVAKQRAIAESRKEIMEIGFRKAQEKKQLQRELLALKHSKSIAIARAVGRGVSRGGRATLLKLRDIGEKKAKAEALAKKHSTKKKKLKKQKPKGMFDFDMGF